MQQENPSVTDTILQLYREKKISFLRLAGRRDELQGIIGELETGKPVEIQGISGTGKTCLTEVALSLALLKDKNIMVISRKPGDMENPLYQSITAVSTGEEPLSLPYLADILGVPDGSREEETGLLDSVVRTIQQKNLLIFIDDLHTAARDVHALLTQNIPLVAATRRKTGLPLRSVELGPVEEEEREHLVRIQAGHLAGDNAGNIPERTIKKIQSLSWGYPLLSRLLLTHQEHVSSDSCTTIQEFLDIIDPGEKKGFLDQVFQHIPDEDSHSLFRLLVILNPLLTENINHKYIETVSPWQHTPVLFSNLRNSGYTTEGASQGKVQISIDCIRHAVYTEDPALHAIAVRYYEQFPDTDKKPEIRVEILYHSVMAGAAEDPADEYLSFTTAPFLSDVAACRLIEIGQKLKISVNKSDLTKIYHVLGFVYDLMNRFSESADAYNTAISLWSDGPSAGHHSQLLIDYAGMLNFIGECSAAESLLDQAEELIDQHPGVFSKQDRAMLSESRGKVYDNTGRTDQAAVYHTRALEIRKTLLNQPDNVNTLKYSCSLGYLGWIHVERGDYQAAKKYFTEACEIRKDLTRQSPEEYEKSYSDALRDLGTACFELCEYNKAEQCFREGIEISQRYAVLSPVIHTSGYAAHLKNLGILCLNRKRNEEAEEYLQSAFRYYSELYATSNDAYALSYVYSLSAIAELTIHAGDTQKALVQYTDALELAKKLYEKNPCAYGTSYVITLYNRSKVLHGDQNRCDRSIIDLFTAADVYFRYPKKTYRHYCTLALLLEKIADYYESMGEQNNSEELFLTSWQIIRELADTLPGVYSNQYASSCSTLGDFYNRTGRIPQAEEKYCEAVSIRKNNVLVESEYNLRAYICSLSDLIEFCSENRELTRAERALETHIRYLQQLTGQSPEKYLPAGIELLDHLQSRSSFFRNGLELLKKIVSIIPCSTELIEQYPEIYHAYARLLRKTGWKYYRNNHSDSKSVYVYLQSLTISKYLAKNISDDYNREYGKILNEIAFLYYHRGYMGDALLYCSQAIELWKNLAENDPLNNARHYSRSLDIMAEITQETGTSVETEKCYLTEVTLWKNRLETFPDATSSPYAQSLNDLAVFYYSQKRTDEAITCIKSSIQHSLHLMDDEYYPWESYLSERAENFHMFHTRGPGYLNKTHYHHQMVDFIEEISIREPEQYLKRYANITAIFAHILFADARYNQSIMLLSTIISKFYSDTPQLSDPERLILAKAYYNTGIVQKENNQPKKAMHSFRTAISYFSRVKDTDIAGVKKFLEEARIQCSVAKSVSTEKQVTKKKNSHIKHRDVRDFFDEENRERADGIHSLTMSITRIRKKPGSSPTLIYDGGRRAVIHRNRSMVVILNNFERDLIQKVKLVREVTIREIDKKDHRVISKYLVPVKWVNNLVIPIWYEKDDTKNTRNRDTELSEKTPLWHSDIKFLT